MLLCANIMLYIVFLYALTCLLSCYIYSNIFQTIVLCTQIHSSVISDHCCAHQSFLTILLFYLKFVVVFLICLMTSCSPKYEIHYKIQCIPHTFLYKNHIEDWKIHQHLVNTPIPLRKSSRNVMLYKPMRCSKNSMCQDDLWTHKTNWVCAQYLILDFEHASYICAP